MAKEENIKTQEKLGESVANSDFDAFDDIFAPDVVDHDPAPEQGSGPEGFKAMFRNMKSAFPDLVVEADHIVADDEHVCLAYRMLGTHEGEFQGIAPTGKKIEARGVQIARFDENARIIERWGSSNQLSIINQLKG